ncbi:hypothetical protein LPN01_17080 [Sphingomonas sp. A2-49]|uniref:hypothetical protein n=1 Tax=Sphingomonas sp. A2-49 TaxID=1391375 RepID=UPI0021D2A7D9|nr:hypothetical protein [Sphingomonas sp. A2-49]MCU6455796.1 hypothetical protein [Sphingomonas sp. A2-49]
MHDGPRRAFADMADGVYPRPLHASIGMRACRASIIRTVTLHRVCGPQRGGRQGWRGLPTA